MLQSQRVSTLYQWVKFLVVLFGSDCKKSIYCTYTVYPKKYAHGFCFAVLCCGYTLADFPYPSGLLHWHCESNDCPSASKATLMTMDKYFMWIHYERLHIHNKAKHNKTVCIFLGYTVHIYCLCMPASHPFQKSAKLGDSQYLNPLRAKFFWGNINIYLHLCHYSTLISHRYLNFLLK